MSDDFFSNLQAATSNLDDIIFNRFATVVEINTDGTVNCREEEGLTHNNVLNPTVNAEVGDAVILMFMENSIYDPVIIANITHDLKKSFDEINASIEEVSLNKADKTHTHVIGDVSGLVDAIYPVGCIYMSVNNADPSLLFGGTWQQIEDTFLLASGSTYAAGDTGGSADAVVVKHNHTQNPHNHTQNAHNHTANADGKQSFLTAPTGSSWNEVAGSKISGSGYHYVATKDKSNYNVWVSQTANKTATNQAQTATNQESGVDGTGKNMPPYLAVYMWQRTG